MKELILFMIFSSLCTANYVEMYCQASKFRYSITCTDIVSMDELKNIDYQVSKVSITDSKIPRINSTDFETLNMIKELELNNIGLQNIEVNTFSNLVNLVSIEITYNNITHMEKNMFSGLTNVTKLNMTSNYLTSLENINELNNLQELYVKNNRLSEINKDDFKGMINLIILDLSYNRIRVLENIDKLIKLKELYISHNFIIINDNSFKGLKLTNLDISYANINSTNVIDKIYTLEKLNIGSNNLQVLHQFEHLEYLQILDVTNNSLRSLSSKLFVFSPNLKELYAQNNDITYIAKDIFYISISHVNISDNFLENDISCIQFNDTVNLAHNYINTLCKFNNNTRHIDLDDNELEHLQKLSFYNLKHLQYLNIPNNLISTVDEDTFITLYNLSYLSLQNNFISEIKVGTFRDLSNLITLHLSKNNIEDLSIGVFSGVYNLSVLDLSHNSFKYIHTEVFYPLRHLNSLYLQGNPLVTLDHQILTKYMPSLSHLSVEYAKISCNTLHKILKHYKEESVTIKTIEGIEGHNIYGIECNPDEPDYESNTELWILHKQSIFSCFLLISILFFILFISYTVSWCEKLYEMNINSLSNNTKSSSVILIDENEDD